MYIIVKCFLGILLVMALLLTGAALAVEATDAPGTPTHDVVLSLTANWMDEENTAYEMEVMEPDQLTMDTVTEIYKFVYEQGMRPVRYFPEETQRQIEAMLEGVVDPDALYMTEFMRLHAAEAEPEADLLAQMLVDVDYQSDQLVLVVLGDTSDPEELVWTPVESRVVELGKLEFIVPQALMEQLQGEDVLFSLLTVRKGARGGVVSKETRDVEHIQMPSKTARDTVKVKKLVAADGTQIEDDFELLVVEESEIILRELAQIRAHVKEEEQPVCTWLPDEDRDEIQLLLGEGIDLDELVVYDYLPLITKNYRDSYGDVISAFSFATPYEAGQQVVTVLGLPRETPVEGETLMDWAVQRAQVNENGEVEIVFDQLALLGMGEETGLLLLLCEPIAE